MAKEGTTYYNRLDTKDLYSSCCFFVFISLQTTGGYGDEHNVAENDRYYSAGINPLYSLGFVK